MHIRAIQHLCKKIVLQLIEEVVIFTSW